MSGVEIREVAESEAGMRLDRWLQMHRPGLGYGRLQKLLRTGQVRVDGARAKAALRLAAGQRVRLPPMSSERAHAPARERSASARPLEEADRAFVRGLVIHRDREVIALDKPPGLPVQGGTRTERHLDAMLDGLREAGEERPRLVHRLDRDTSGVLLLARTRRAAQRLGRALKARSAAKLYWALVVGVPRPSEGVIDAPLVKAGGKGEERVHVARTGEPGAKAARTRYRVIAHAGQRLAWLALQPETGRTHQLRAHMAAIGHPIVGDGKYGGASAHPGGEIARRLHLHARRIRLPHPSGGMLEVSAPLPEHMARSWELLGFEADMAAESFLEE